MSFEKHFLLTDDYIEHTDEYILSLDNEFVKTRFTGFLSVNAVTVYELCIKDILIEFTTKKNPVFGEYTANNYSRINGRIKIQDLISIAKKFGDKYQKRFNRILTENENSYLKDAGSSIKSSYGNIITWRHKFAHDGEIPVNATYEEVKNSYILGKIVIACFDKAMKR